MKRSRLFIFVGILVLIILGYISYRYLYQEARNINDEKAAFVVDANTLINEYSANAEGADKQYLNKTIEVNGAVTSVSDSVVTLDSAVFCGFDQLVTLPVNQKVTIKGRCIGYDELFNEVKLDQCAVIINNL